MPELESIVEPVLDDEPTTENEDTVSSKPDEASVISSEPDEVSTISVISSEPESAPPAESKVMAHEPIPTVSSNAEPRQELLHNIAPDPKLDIEEIEKELLRLINSLRDEVQVTKLGKEDDMQFAARIRAAEVLESFSHTRPDKTPYNTAFDEAGFSYAGKWHGENLSSLSFSTGLLSEKEIALEMFNALKDSPGHRQNMTGEKFVQAGIGVAVSYGDGVVDIASAQLFSSL